MRNAKYIVCSENSFLSARGGIDQPPRFVCYNLSLSFFRIDHTIDMQVARTTERARRFTKLSPLHEHEARGQLTSVVWSRRQWLADGMDNSHVNWIVGIISGSSTTR